MTHVNVRFAEQDKILLVEVCRERREDLSGFVRRSVMAELARLSYLPSETVKALGVETK